MLRKYQVPGYKEKILQALEGKKQSRSKKGSEIRNASDASTTRKQWDRMY